MLQENENLDSFKDDEDSGSEKGFFTGSQFHESALNIAENEKIAQKSQIILNQHESSYLSNRPGQKLSNLNIKHRSKSSLL